MGGRPPEETQPIPTRYFLSACPNGKPLSNNHHKLTDWTRRVYNDVVNHSSATINHHQDKGVGPKRQSLGTGYPPATLSLQNGRQNTILALPSRPRIIAVTSCLPNHHSGDAVQMTMPPLSKFPIPPCHSHKAGMIFSPLLTRRGVLGGSFNSQFSIGHSKFKCVIFYPKNGTPIMSCGLKFYSHPNRLTPLIDKEEMGVQLLNYVFNSYLLISHYFPPTFGLRPTTNIYGTNQNQLISINMHGHILRSFSEGVCSNT